MDEGEDPFDLIRDCCSKSGGFITPRLPILEAVFRLFLANGNQPMDLEQIKEKLKGWHARATPPEAFERLLKSDRYYGLCRIGSPLGERGGMPDLSDAGDV